MTATVTHYPNPDRETCFNTICDGRPAKWIVESGFTKLPSCSVHLARAAEVVLNIAPTPFEKRPRSPDANHG